MVTTIIGDLNQLKAGSAINVPLAEFAESQEKVRSALNATRNVGRKVATASDGTFAAKTNGVAFYARIN